MSASTVRNALSSRRRTHRERAQPKARKKFGLLEKKKDYKQRAVDYHRKEDRINALKESASQRNPDEFYFGMHKSRTKDGVHVLDRKESKKYSASALKIMNTQDAAYLQAHASMEDRRIATLKSRLHCLDDDDAVGGGGDGDNDSESNRRNKHVVFCDTKKKIADFSAAEYFDTAPELAGRTFNRPRTATLRDGSLLNTTSKRALSKAGKQRAQQYRELDDRMQRKRKLDGLLHDVKQRRLLMGKGRRTKITQTDRFGDVDKSKTVYKWKLERKK